MMAYFGEALIRGRCPGVMNELYGRAWLCMGALGMNGPPVGLVVVSVSVAVAVAVVR